MPIWTSHQSGIGSSEFSEVSAGLEQPGSGSVAPAKSRESFRPSPSSSEPLEHFGGGAGSVRQLRTFSCSSAVGPLRRQNAIVYGLSQLTGPLSTRPTSTIVASGSLSSTEASATGSYTVHSRPLLAVHDSTPGARS